MTESTSDRRPPTAAVHDVQGHVGDLPNSIRSLSHGKYLIGAAYPCLLAPGSNMWIHKAIYRAPRDSVLVIATSDRGSFGYFGETLMMAAMQQGIRGVVIDGGVRDVGVLRDADFPVFCSEISMRAAGKAMENGSTGSPVKIGATTIHPGDLVVGDDDGVVIVPAQDIDKTIELAIRHEIRDRELAEKMKQGIPLYELTGRPM